jgi:formyltetrahydrofolate deformylase
VATWILTLSCRDRPGIVHAVSGAIASTGGNITSSQQYGDSETGRFFMRVAFTPGAGQDRPTWRADFDRQIASTFAMDWQLHDSDHRTRTLIMVSKAGHCLNDLLFRTDNGSLALDVRGVVGNHTVLAPVAERFGVPFRHIPVDPRNKDEAEARVTEMIREQDVELVVLARYMQILSDRLAGRLAGRSINIHHSFLPSFKGAAPYQQAHDRGVKLIGATAHYVTADLDEGPIIEQDVARVGHALSPDELASTGRDIEAVVLARAVRWHTEHRILLNGRRTVVFR